MAVAVICAALPRESAAGLSPFAIERAADHLDENRISQRDGKVGIPLVQLKQQRHLPPLEGQQRKIYFEKDVNI